MQPPMGGAELARFADPERPQKIRAAAEQRRGELEGMLRALGAPGFAWGLVVDDRLVLSGGEGTTSVVDGAPVSAQTLFRIGSITKVLTLRDAGQLSLDAPMRQYLPQFEGVVYPTAGSPEITPRHLLLHRSGLPRLGAYDPGLLGCFASNVGSSLLLQVPRISAGADWLRAPTLFS